jgi:hypothetical protein
MEGQQISYASIYYTVLTHRYHVDIVPDDLYYNFSQRIHIIYCGNLTNLTFNII